MFRARWAALALSAGLLVTSSGCLFNRCWSWPGRHDCDCACSSGANGYDMAGAESPVLTGPSFGSEAPPIMMPPASNPPPMLAPPPRVVPIPQAPPSQYSPAKFFRN